MCLLKIEKNEFRTDLRYLCFAVLIDALIDLLSSACTLLFQALLFNQLCIYTEDIRIYFTSPLSPFIFSACGAVYPWASLTSTESWRNVVEVWRFYIV